MRLPLIYPLLRGHILAICFSNREDMVFSSLKPNIMTSNLKKIKTKNKRNKGKERDRKHLVLIL